MVIIFCFISGGYSRSTGHICVLCDGYQHLYSSDCDEVCFSEKCFELLDIIENLSAGVDLRPAGGANLSPRAPSQCIN